MVGSSISAQDIIDDGTPTRIYDALLIGEDTLTYYAFGSCLSGSLERKNSTESSFYGCGYSPSGLLKEYNNDWFLVANSMIADDVIGNYLTFVYEDETQELVRFTSDQFQELEMNDFAFKDTEIIVLTKNLSNTLVCMTKEAEVLSTVELPFNPMFITNLSHDIALITNQNIHLYTPNLSPISSVAINGLPIAYEVYDGSLFILFENSVEVYSSNLQLLQSILLPASQSFLDIEVTATSLHVLGNENSNYVTHVFDFSTNLWDSLNLIENDLIELNRYHKNDPKQIIGSFEIEDFESNGIKNAVIVDVNENYSSNDLIELEWFEVEEDKYLFEIIIDGNDTIEVFNYTYDIRYSVKNVSDSVINSFLVSSNRENGFNCAWVQYQKKFSNLQLLPNESMVIETTKETLSRKFDEMCLFAISANDLVDPQFDNNQLCEFILSDFSLPVKRDIKVYPNVSSDYINIEGQDSQPIAVKILTVGGIEVLNFPKGKMDSIHISTLNPGLYFVLIELGGKLSMHRIIKY